MSKDNLKNKTSISSSFDLNLQAPLGNFRRKESIKITKKQSLIAKRLSIDISNIRRIIIYINIQK
jgi:hypothetical protein